MHIKDIFSKVFLSEITQSSTAARFLDDWLERRVTRRSWGQVLTACCPKPFFTISIEQNKDIFAQREKVLCIIYKRLREYSKTMHGG